MERKARLEKLLAAGGVGNRIRYVAHLESNAEAVLSSARKWDSRASCRRDSMRPTARPLRQLDQSQMPRGARSSPGRLDHGTRHPALAARRRPSDGRLVYVGASALGMGARW